MSFNSALNIKVRVSRFELFPKDTPREYKVGFVVTHTRNKTSRYFEGKMPFSELENSLSEEDIAVFAWDKIKEQVAEWYTINKGIVGYTFDIPQEDFEKIISMGFESGLMNSNMLYRYLGIDVGSNVGSNVDSNINVSSASTSQQNKDIIMERQLL